MPDIVNPSPARIGLLVLLAVGMLCWPASATDAIAQEDAPDTDAEFIMSIEVKLVNLFVTVVDRKGRVVKNLDHDDFLVWEDGVPQRISHFTTYDKTPLSLAVVLDISGSMATRQKFEHSCRVIRSLAAGLEELDEMALFTFADNVAQIAVPFTTDKEAVVRKLDELKPYGKTALYWAVDILPAIIGNPKHRQAVILFTDGRDNLSDVGLEDMLEHTQRAQIPIYPVGFTYRSSPFAKPEKDGVRKEVLKTIAAETGGAYLEVPSFSHLLSLIQRTMSELRYQYLLGYNSNQPDKPGQYRKVRLQTRKGSYIVRARQGYYVSE